MPCCGGAKARRGEGLCANEHSCRSAHLCFPPRRPLVEEEVVPPAVTNGNDDDDDDDPALSGTSSHTRTVPSEVAVASSMPRAG